MKVAFLSYDFPEYCTRLASALAQDAEVSLLLPRRQAAGYGRLLDAQVRFLPFDKPRYRQAGQQLRLLGKLVQTIRRLDPDVLHLQQGHLWFNLALPLLRRYPLVLTVHDPRHHLGDHESRKVPRFVTEFGFRRASQLIVHAQQSGEVLTNECGIPAERVHVIPHILLQDEPPTDAPTEDNHLILFFGRIWEYKGLEYLIRAEPLIAEQVPQVRIAIAGAGEDFGRYRRLMVNPERFIVRNEYVSDHERAELFRRASVIVLPYVDASQSGVIPLAYTASKPVVATTVGGLPEAVEDGKTGLLVPPRDERALASAIIRLLQDRELRQRLGAGGWRKIHAECSPRVVGAQTRAVYRRALEPRPALAGVGSIR